ncbi:MAG: hypothetical protein QG635_1851 [Bacteroidota bacterium]|nr:hypothetical protein [Bacteroidota bacterium]
MKKLFFKLVILSILTVGAITELYALPRTPLQFAASFVSGSTPKIHLSWRDFDSSGSGSNPTNFRIFHASGQTYNMGDFTELSDPVVDWTTMGNYSVDIDPPGSGWHSYCIKAWNSDGYGNPSSISQVYVPTADVVVNIISSPSATATRGVEYLYDVDAVTDPSSTYTIRYRFPSSFTPPTGMVIDNETGEISWTPLTSQIGYNNITVHAYLLEDEGIYDEQSWLVSVKRCTDSASVTGTITDEHGVPIESGTIFIYRADGDSSTMVRYFTGGNFSFNLDSGGYVLYFNGNSFDPEWYRDKVSRSTADIILADCGEVLNISDPVVVARRLDGSLVFNTTAPTSAYLTAPYLYDAEAAYTGSGTYTIKYDLTDSPADMYINENTGSITWTPAAIGPYQVALRAYLEDYPAVSVSQTWTVNVLECDTPPVFTGTVRDQDGNIINGGEVRFLLWTGTDFDDTHDYHTTITDGVFTMTVDKGMYYISFIGAEFETEWYDNVSSISSATYIEVDCDAHVNLDVILRKFKMRNISGNVKMASSGDPVVSARVEFFGSNLETTSPLTFTSFTNLAGNYSIDLTDRYNYIASFSGDSGKVTDVLKPMFYNQVFSPVEATVLILTGDLNDIDFLLQNKPTETNSLSGTVERSGGAPLSDFYVMAFLDDGSSTVTQRSSVTNSSGEYMFESLPAGNYVLLAFPTASFAAIPGYYKAPPPAAEAWADATRIALTGTSNITGKDIILSDIPPLDGLASVNGFIAHGGYRTLKIGDSPTAADEPLTGVFVKAYDSQGKLIAFSFTDNTGNFEISGLDVGKYKIIVDRFGFEPDTLNVEIKDKISSVKADFDMKPQMTGVPDFYEYDTDKVTIIPNPADDKLNIVLNIEGRFSAVIMNSLGEEIKSVQVNTQISGNTFSVETAGMPSGCYFLKIECAGRYYIKPFIVAH